MALTTEDRKTLSETIEKHLKNIKQIHVSIQSAVNVLKDDKLPPGKTAADIGRTGLDVGPG